LDEATGGDRPVLLVEHGGVRARGVDSANGGSLAALAGLVGLRVGGMRVRRSGLRNRALRTRKQSGTERRAGKQGNISTPRGETQSSLPAVKRSGFRGMGNRETLGNQRGHGASTHRNILTIPDVVAYWTHSNGGGGAQRCC